MPKVNFYIGSEFFREIRESNSYYVDKTKLIEELLCDLKTKAKLFTRPRRFGKTLTMNMLKEFFDINSKNKKNIFEGLAISENKQLCKEWQNQSPVISLTLKECTGRNFEEALGQFSTIIGETCASLSELQESPSVTQRDKKILLTLEDSRDITLLENSLKVLCRALHAHYKKKVILLIDEYDVPINHAYQREYYPTMTDFMRNFLGSALKSNEFLEFAVLTGCLRIAKESIFTGLNNFRCFGISDIQFADAIGFTSKEVNAILADAEIEDKKPLLKEWYDGYIFGNDTEIYCPWDVQQYVADVQNDNTAKPKLYWNNSSGNDIIKDFLENKHIDITDDFETLMAGGCVEITLSDQQTYNLDKSPPVSGYLSYKAKYI